MRTDDFDEVQPQDTDEPRPDKAAIDIDTGPEDFNEFDRPQTAGGNSLGELWRNNPLIKVAVIVIGIVTLVAGYIIFGGGNGDAPKSTVGTAVQDSVVPGGPTTDAYRDAINDVNQQRLEQALQTGSSTIPIPTAGNEVPSARGVGEEPPVTLEDPLADWRAAVQQPVAGEPQQPQLEQQPLQPGYPAQQQAMPMGPDPAAVDALGQAMSQQMAAILDKHKISGAQVMSVTSVDFLTKNNQAEVAGNAAITATGEDEVEEILVPAGTIAYAQTMTEANSDVPGPVLARISSGPLTGSRVLGEFENRNKKLVLRFTKVVIKGVAYPIDAIALDPKTTLPAVASDVDNRYWERFVLPAAAAFIEGMGDAIAQREQTVVVTGDTAVQSTPDLNTKEEIAAGFAEGTRSISEDMDEAADRIEPLVRVYAGTPVGILFLEPVIKNDTN